MIQVQPAEGIQLHFQTKVPDAGMKLRQTDLDFSFQREFRGVMPEAYERLLLDALEGDASLFARADEVEAAWAIFDPILADWQAQRPAAAAHLRARPVGPRPSAPSGWPTKAANGSTSALSSGNDSRRGPSPLRTNRLRFSVPLITPCAAPHPLASSQSVSQFSCPLSPVVPLWFSKGIDHDDTTAQRM